MTVALMLSPPRLIISLRRPVRRDVAVLVDDGHVAGLEEAVRVEDLGVLLGVLVVAGEHRRALEQQLALSVRRQRVAVEVHHLVDVARAGRPAHRAADRLDVVLGRGDGGHALGGAVAVVEAHVQPAEDLADQLGERGAAGAVHLLEAAEVVLVQVLVLQQPLGQGRHPDDRGDLLPLDGLADGLGVGGVEHEQLAHGDDAAQEALGERQVVADGAHDEVDVLAVLVPGLASSTRRRSPERCECGARSWAPRWCRRWGPCGPPAGRRAPARPAGPCSPASARSPRSAAPCSTKPGPSTSPRTVMTCLMAGQRPARRRRWGGSRSCRTAEALPRPPPPEISANRSISCCR